MLSRFWSARGPIASTGAANHMVEQLLVAELQMPMVASAIACRHLAVLTTHDARGPLYDLDLCYNVMDGADDGLDLVVGPAWGARGARFRAAWSRFRRDRNPATARWLPEDTPQTLQHCLCELRKFKSHEKHISRAPPRCPEEHRMWLRNIWHLLWKGQPPQPPLQQPCASGRALCSAA